MYCLAGIQQHRLLIVPLLIISTSTGDEGFLPLTSADVACVNFMKPLSSIAAAPRQRMKEIHTRFDLLCFPMVIRCCDGTCSVLKVMTRAPKLSLGTDHRNASQSLEDGKGAEASNVDQNEGCSVEAALQSLAMKEKCVVFEQHLLTNCVMKCVAAGKWFAPLPQLTVLFIGCFCNNCVPRHCCARYIGEVRFQLQLLACS